MKQYVINSVLWWCWLVFIVVNFACGREIRERVRRIVIVRLSGPFASQNGLITILSGWLDGRSASLDVIRV